MPFSTLERKSKQQHRPEANCLSNESGTCFVPKYLQLAKIVINTQFCFIYVFYLFNNTIESQGIWSLSHFLH